MYESCFTRTGRPWLRLAVIVDISFVFCKKNLLIDWFLITIYSSSFLNSNRNTANRWYKTIVKERLAQAPHTVTVLVKEGRTSRPYPLFYMAIPLLYLLRVKGFSISYVFPN